MSPTTETIVSLIETLPEAEQQKVADHLREYIAEMQSEMRWDAAFAATKDQLIEAARRAQAEADQGLAEPMDYNRL